MQPLAELVGVLSHGTVLLGLERDENIAVADAQSRVVAECQVETARGDADVIDDVIDLARRDDLADLVFDIGEDGLRLFDARAGGRPGMQPQLPESTVGKKSSPTKTDSPRDATTNIPNPTSTGAR